MIICVICLHFCGATSQQLGYLS